MLKIAILDDYANVALQLADWSGLDNCETTVFTTHLGSTQQVAEQLQPFDIICIMRERTPFPASLIESLPNLKLIVTSGPRNLSIDLSSASENNVVVCGTESRKTTTSEMTLLLMLALTRELIPEVNALHETGWQSHLGRDLHGLDLGLIGLGKIGAQVAVLGKALGMSVHAWSQNLERERCDALDVKYHDSLDSLMQHSDVVSVHLVLSDRTQGLINQQAFASMRDRALFINTSRGPIADEAALLEGLRNQRPWKAAIDVYDQEPLPADSPWRDSALIESGQLLLTPHLGYVTEQTWRLFYTQMVEAIAAWQSGNPIRVLGGS